MKNKILVIFNISLILALVFAFASIPPNVMAAMMIDNVSPSIISNQKANTITVTGAEFSSGAVVSLDGYAQLTTSFFSSTSLLAIVPAGIPNGVYTVTVTNPDTSTASLPDALSVVPVAPTAVPTPTIQPPVGYERPVIVVSTYSTDQDRIAPGDYFQLFVTLYNAGQQYAKNIVATFTSTDLIPRETGGVVAVGEIAPGNRADFSQPFIMSGEAWSAIASASLLVTYLDENGMGYSETFTISLPVYHVYSPVTTATSTPTASPTPSNRAQLVISSYATDIVPLQPGTQFNLSLSIENKGNSTARRVTMIVGGGTASAGGGGTDIPGGVSGASGEFTNFAPIGASNVQSLGDFSAGTQLAAHQPLIVNVSTNPGAYPLKISFVYLDEQNHSITDDQVITLLVYRLPMVEISFYQQLAPFFSGQGNMLPLQVVNLGRNSVVLGNMKVTASSGQFTNNAILVGTLDPGGYFTLDANYIPDLAGPTDLIVTIDYTNDFNQSEVITKTLSVDVMEQQIIEPPVNGGQDGGEVLVPQEPESFLHKIWRFILGLLGLDSGNKTTQPGGMDQSIATPAPGGPKVVPPLKGP